MGGGGILPGLALPTITVGGIITITTTGYVLPNACVAVTGWGFSQMWVATLTGENREVIDGHVGYGKIAKAQDVSIPVGFISEVDADGTELNLGLYGGLWSNIYDLRYGFGDPSAGGAGIVSGTFEGYDDATAVSVSVQYDELKLGDDPSVGVLHIVLVDGPVSFPAGS